MQKDLVESVKFETERKASCLHMSGLWSRLYQAEGVALLVVAEHDLMTEREQTFICGSAHDQHVEQHRHKSHGSAEPLLSSLSAHTLPYNRIVDHTKALQRMGASLRVALSVVSRPCTI